MTPTRVRLFCKCFDLESVVGLPVRSADDPPSAAMLDAFRAYSEIEHVRMTSLSQEWPSADALLAQYCCLCKVLRVLATKPGVGDSWFANAPANQRIDQNAVLASIASPQHSIHFEDCKCALRLFLRAAVDLGSEQRCESWASIANRAQLI